MAQTLLGLVIFVLLVVVSLLGLQAGGAVPQAVIVMLSALVGWGVWHAQEDAKRAHELEAKLVANKKSLYGVYIDVLRGVFQKGTKGGTFDRELKQLRAFVFGAMLIASDEVIIAQNRFMRAQKLGDGMTLPALADLMLAMRRDGGEVDTTLRPIDVLAGVVTDIENHAPTFEQWAKEGSSVWPGPELVQHGGGRGHAHGSNRRS